QGISHSRLPERASRAIKLSPPKNATAGFLVAPDSNITGVARPENPCCSQAISPVGLLTAAPPAALQKIKSSQISADPAWPYWRSPLEPGSWRLQMIAPAAASQQCRV